MDKYVNLKGTSNSYHLKYIIGIPEKKMSPYYSDTNSIDFSPQSAKSSKLEPLESTYLSSKPEPLTPNRGITQRRQGTKDFLAKPFNTPQKTWKLALDADLTPKEDKQTDKKSKFVVSFTSMVEKSKQFTGPYGDQSSQPAQPITPTTPKTVKLLKGLKRESPSGSSIAVSQQQISEDRTKMNVSEEKNRPSTQSNNKAYTVRNISTPTFKPTHRKIVETGLTITQSKSEEALDVHKKLLNKNDPCAGLPFRHLIFGAQVETEVFKRYLAMLHQGLLYVTKNLKSPSDKFIKTKQVTFVDSIATKTKTLLLDLDETLIHSCVMRNKPDVVLTYQAPGEPVRQLPIKVRPYVKEFLNRVSPLYEVAVFTASASCYARAIVDYLDKDRRIIQNILTRENCMETRNGFFIKDLRIIQNRDLKDMIIVDNLVHSFGFQIDNGIPILEFTGDKKDEELKHLANYLVEAYNCPDIREFNRERIKLRAMAEKKPEDLFGDLLGL